jgi:hypothetical protein
MISACLSASNGESGNAEAKAVDDKHRLGTGTECGASGEHIVDQQHMVAGQTLGMSHREGARDVVCTAQAALPALLSRVSLPHDSGRFYRSREDFGNAATD